MAISGRTSDECFDQFLEHVRGLVGSVLTTRFPILCPRGPKAARLRTLRFANPQDSHAIPLDTRAHGTVYLYMAQELTTEQREHGDGFELHTKRYWYKVFGQSPVQSDDAIVRWEYASANPIHDTPCRHHVQFGKMVAPLKLGDSEFDFTRFHMPTGWVTMEELCRFMICELGIEPPCGRAWPEVLADGERHFYSKATDRGASGHNRKS